MAVIPMPPGTVSLASLASLNSNTLLVATGNQTVTGSLNQSGLAAGIDIVNVQPSATVSFSDSSGGALQATILTTIKHEGSGGIFKYQPVTTTGVTCPRIQNIGGASFSIVSGPTAAVVKVEQGGSGGRIDIDDSSKVTTAAICAGAMDVQYLSTAITTLYASSGSFSSARSVTTAYIGGSAQCFFGRTDGLVSNLPTATTINMGGGKLTWCGGDVTTIVAFGGTLDFSNVPAAMTIGTLTATWDVIQRSKFKSSGSSNLVTITTLVVLGGPVDAIVQ